MGKGNGTTRQSASSSPKGLTAPNGYDTDIKLIQTKGWTNSGGGMWELNTPHADASIILEEDATGMQMYEIQTVGAENIERGFYTSDSPGRKFYNLNAAKEAAREELERYYKKVNSL